MKFNNVLITIQKKELEYADHLLKKSEHVLKDEDNFSKAVEHINNSLEIYKKYKIYDKIKDSYNNLNQLLNQYNQIDEAKQQAVEALSYFEIELKNYQPDTEDYSILKRGIANAYANHGIALTREEDFERARYYFSLSSSVYEHYGNWDQRTQLYINLAGVNKVVGNFNQSIHYLNKSLANASKTKDSNNIYHTIILQLGNFYMQQENFEKSIEFFNKSFSYADEKESLKKFLVNVHYCIAYCYLELFDEKKCIENLNKAIELDEQTDANLYDAHITLLKARLLSQQGNFNEAIPYYAKCLRIDSGISVKTRRLNCISSIISFKINASEKQSDLLEEILRKNYLPDINELIAELNESEIKIYNIWGFKKAFETLSIYYEKQKNYKEAHKYTKKVNNLYNRLTQININDQIDAIHHNFDIYLLNKRIEAEVNTKNTLQQNNNELEEKVEKGTTKLFKQNEQLKKFTNIVAHDLKEPARKINSHVDFFLKQTKNKLNEEETLLINNVLENSERLILMMDDLIIYSFLSEHHKPNKQINANQLIHALIKTYNVSKDVLDVGINLSDLPLIKMSSNHVTQIFRRLIDNSIKFKSEKRALKLYISAFEKNQIQHIKVQDNGIGFDQKEEAKAFKMFQKLHGDKYPGNGVGLAVCKKIVELYDHSIYIETEPGNGTTVIFSVPT